MIELDLKVTADNRKHFGEPVYEYTIAQGIEDGYLRNRTQQRFNDLHSFELGAIVKRGERRHAGDFRSDGGSQPNRVFVFRTAMHHAVPDDVNLGK